LDDGEQGAGKERREVQPNAERAMGEKKVAFGNLL